MQRKQFRYSVTRPGAMRPEAEGVKFAHNSALEASTGAVRSIARVQGVLFTKGGVTRDEVPAFPQERAATIQWLNDDGTVALIVRVERVA